MKKIINRITIITLFTVLSFVLLACRREVDTESINASMTQLEIQIYEGALGSEYMTSLENRFEEAYKDYVSPSGKVGVQVRVEASKSCSGAKLSDSKQSWNKDIYFANNCQVYNQMVKNGFLLDITDVVSEIIEGENKSIKDKLSNSYKEWYEIDGKYYGLPQYEASSGFVYDIDLFNNNRLYISKTYENSIELSEKFSCSLGDADIAYGPDDIKGTADDGLPATYQDFYDLCEFLVSRGILPIVCNNFPNYLTATVSSMFADYAGSEQLDTFFHFSGTCDIVSGFDENNNPIIESKTITNDNGWEVFKQPGIYYSLKFIENIIYHTSWYQIVGDHLDAQSRFVMSSAPGSKKIAMLVESPYWYREATIARNSLYQINPNEENHRYGMLYLPKAVEAGGASVLLDTTFTTAFINSDIDQDKVFLAKKFIQFCFTNESLSNFTKYTSLTAPYEYTMSEEDYQQTSSIGKQMYDVHLSAKYYVCANQTPIYLKNSNISSPAQLYKNSIAEYPHLSFERKRQNAGGYTAEEYFDEVVKYRKSQWDVMR